LWGEAREHAARLHVVKLGQRQVKQAVKQRLPQREHEADVEDALAVVLERAEQVRGDDDRQVGAAASCSVQKRPAVSRARLRRTLSMVNRMNSGWIISMRAVTSANTIATPNP
jgi:hypothetical protein